MNKGYPIQDGDPLIFCAGDNKKVMIEVITSQVTLTKVILKPYTSELTVDLDQVKVLLISPDGELIEVREGMSNPEKTYL